jgi:hypothetical protein
MASTFYLYMKILQREKNEIASSLDAVWFPKENRSSRKFLSLRHFVSLIRLAFKIMLSKKNVAASADSVELKYSEEA